MIRRFARKSVKINKNFWTISSVSFLRKNKSLIQRTAKSSNVGFCSNFVFVVRLWTCEKDRKDEENLTSTNQRCAEVKTAWMKVIFCDFSRSVWKRWNSCFWLAKVRTVRMFSIVSWAMAKESAVKLWIFSEIRRWAFPTNFPTSKINGAPIKHAIVKWGLRRNIMTTVPTESRKSNRSSWLFSMKKFVSNRVEWKGRWIEVNDWWRSSSSSERRCSAPKTNDQIDSYRKIRFLVGEKRQKLSAEVDSSFDERKNRKFLVENRRKVRWKKIFSFFPKQKIELRFFEPGKTHSDEQKQIQLEIRPWIFERNARQQTTGVKWNEKFRWRKKNKISLSFAFR